MPCLGSDCKIKWSFNVCLINFFLYLKLFFLNRAKDDLEFDNVEDKLDEDEDIEFKSNNS